MSQQIAAYATMVLTWGLMVFAFLVGLFIFRLEARYLGGYSFAEQASQKDNPAVIIRFTGTLAALMMATFGAYHVTGEGILADFSSAVMALVCAFIALFVSRIVNDSFILTHVDNTQAVVEQKNVAVAIVELFTYLATACIFIGGMQDSSHGLIYNVVWFALGQGVLIGLAWIYRLFMSEVFEQIEVKNNCACALSLGGILLSGGIVIGVLIAPASSASFAEDIFALVTSIVAWAVVLLFSKVIINRTIIPGRTIMKEIKEDANWGFGLMDASTSIVITAIIILLHVN